MEILIHKDGQNYGPFTPEQVKQGLKEGRVTLHDWACTRDKPSWRPLHEVLAEAATPHPRPPMPPGPPGLQGPPIQPNTHVGNPQLNSILRTFLNEEQDPAIVTKVYDHLMQICTPDETVLYIAVQQKLLINLAPASVALTNKRVIVFRPKAMGLGLSFEDAHWLHVANIHISQSLTGSTFYVTLLDGRKFSVDALPKAQARRLYQAGQQMEEEMIRHRRELRLEEQRAGAANVSMNVNNNLQGNPYGQLPTHETLSPGTGPLTALPSGAIPTPENPVQKLQQLKQMLDAGLITPQEYESKKAEIMARF